MLSTHGLADEIFLRGKAPIRRRAKIHIVSLGEAELKKDSVCYDVGAGTARFTVEMTMKAYEGRVYAVEKKRDLRLLPGKQTKFTLVVGDR